MFACYLKDFPLGQKRLRLAAGALCRQRQFTSLLEDFEELDEDDEVERVVNPAPLNLIINYSMTSYCNLSTFQPQVDYEEDDEEED